MTLLLFKFFLCFSKSLTSHDPYFNIFLQDKIKDEMFLLSHTSKVFERILCKQVENFMSKNLPKLCGFGKNCNTQYGLHYMP